MELERRKKKKEIGQLIVLKIFPILAYIGYISQRIAVGCFLLLQSIRAVQLSPC